MLEVNESGKQRDFRQRSLATLNYVMGPEICGYMQDENVIEIIVNPDGKLWIDTKEKGRVFTGQLIAPELAEQIIYQVANFAGKICNEQHASLAAEFPGDGSRFQGMLPKLVAAPSFVIRKHALELYTLEDYVQQDVMSNRQANIIREAIANKKNIIVAGGTKSGKTTFLNAVLQEIVKLNERIITIEDIKELNCKAINLWAMLTDSTHNQDDLLRDALRLTPDRIIVGELRGGEALTFLDMCNTGHDGGAASLHASSAEKALLRLEQLISRVSLNPQQVIIGEAVDVIVFMNRRGTSRYIEEIISVNGYDVAAKRYITKKLGEETGD